MKSCEVCGTEVLPPFHSFCSHDCVDKVAGRKPELVLAHTMGDHGRGPDDSSIPMQKWSRLGMFREKYGHDETPIRRPLAQEWRDQPYKTWFRLGGRQDGAFINASRATREQGREAIDVWPTRS